MRVGAALVGAGAAGILWAFAIVIVEPTPRSMFGASVLVTVVGALAWSVGSYDERFRDEKERDAMGSRLRDMLFNHEQQIQRLFQTTESHAIAINRLAVIANECAKEDSVDE